MQDQIEYANQYRHTQQSRTEFWETKMELWKSTKESPFRKGALLLLDVSFFINDSLHLLHTVGSLYSITTDNEFVVISYVPSVCF